MKRRIQFIICSFIITTSIVAQSTNKISKKDPLQAKDKQALEKLEAAKFLQDYPMRFTESNGTIKELYGLTSKGQILFNKTDNLGAAKTISTNLVWPSGGSGFSLTGSGLTNRLGVWDGGAVRTTHQEFTGRVTQIDGASNIVDHATHVSGTMIGAGVSANAKGGAYQATLKAYEWNSDNSEMTSAAAAGMLVSNHSYGTITGWEYNSSLNRYEWWGDADVSTVEDYKFGFYDGKAQSWDQIAYSYPNYLIFKSAGNDRGEAPSGSALKYIRDQSGTWVQTTLTIAADGPYDCVSLYSTAKNILTVGAVGKLSNGYTTASAVSMSSFSGWGPTDDGRIKPDVVACGLSVYSAISTSNTAYDTYQGTSMAAPNASGSALLLQQHFNNLKGKFMKSASLKGLIIHTADEAGTSTGPDYRFGWGLMNTNKAAQHISDSNKNMIVEASLANLGTYNYTIVSDGIAPLKVTVCWTDIPGTPTTDQLDPTNKMLVNDLDLRVIRNANSEEFQPYILNPALPATAATTGDNSRDNVEQIYIAAPAAGTYTVQVKHKSVLYNNSPQNFSLLLSGRTPAPAANFIVSNRTSCTGTIVTFNDISSSVTSRIWYFPGGNPSTSTQLNPTVIYQNAGTFSVALKVTNASGSDSIYKTDYMLIGGLKIPVNETFEPSSTTLQYWSVNNPNFDSTFRLWNTIAGTSPGNTVVGINNYDNTNASTRDYLISPVLDFRGMQSASLSFKHAYTRVTTSDRDSLIVSISTNCGNTWTRLLTKSENGSGTYATFTRTGDPTFTSQYAFLPAVASVWCGGGIGPSCYTVNLNSYVGVSNVKLRFENYFDGGNNLFLDNINITGVPFAPVAGFSTQQNLCSNQFITLVDTSKNNPTSWNWTITGANISTSTLQKPKVYFNAAGVYTIKLVVTNQSGSDSVTKTISIDQSPSLPIVSFAGNLNLCNGDSTALIGNIQNNYQWYKDSVAISGAINANLFVKNAGKYALRTTDANTCQSQSAIQNVTNGNIPAKATLTKSLVGNQFCEGGSFTLTSSANDSNQWMRGGVDLTGQKNKTLVYSDSGTFVVKVNNLNCFSISDPLTILKLTKPKTSEIFKSRDAYKNDTVTYFVMGETGSTFTWIITGGSILNGQNTPSVLVQWGSGGSASVQVRERGSIGCYGDNKIFAFSLVGNSIEDIYGIKSLKVFPNPATEVLNIEFVSELKQTIVFNLLDIAGKEILKKEISTSKNFISEKMYTSELKKGIYFLRIENAEGKKTIKIALE